MLLWLHIAWGATHGVSSTADLDALLESEEVEAGDVLEIDGDIDLDSFPSEPVVLRGVGNPTLTLQRSMTDFEGHTFESLTLAGDEKLVLLEGNLFNDVVVDGVALEVGLRAELLLEGGAVQGSPHLDVSGSLVAVGVTFLGNSGALGGALTCSSGATCDITDSRFIENVADRGGAIYVNGGNLVVHDSFFCGNAATEEGGALFLIPGDLELAGNSFVDHEANKNGVFFVNANFFAALGALIVDNTFAGATATTGSGLGEIKAQAKVDFSNNLVVGMAGGAADLQEGNGYKGDYNLYFANAGTLPGKANDVTGDPRLVDPFSGCDTVDLRVRLDSPALGAGDPGIDLAIGAHDEADVDVDLDGLLDSEELALGTDPDLADSDGDGVNDGDEVAAGTDPLVADQTDSTPSTGDPTDDALPTQGDSTDSSGASGLAGACGCASSGGPGPWLGLLTLLLWRRRS